MDDKTNDQQVDESVEEELTLDTELKPETDWEAEAKKARGIAQRALTKIKKLSEKKVVDEESKPVTKAQTTGELDETQLDYLDVKGITEQEDIDIIQRVVARTGQTVRQALKDEYVQEKLKANQAQRDVKAATPGSSKRTGNSGGNDLSIAVAKYKQSGFDPSTLPSDFELRSKVINALMTETTSNKPGWK